MKSDDQMQQWFIEHSNKENFQGTMPEALVGAHFMATTFSTLTALGLCSATADGDRSTEIAIAAITVRFINIPCLM